MNFQQVNKPWNEYPIGTVARISGTNTRWTKLSEGWARWGGHISSKPIGADEVQLPQPVTDRNLELIAEKLREIAEDLTCCDKSEWDSFHDAISATINNVKHDLNELA